MSVRTYHRCYIPSLLLTHASQKYLDTLSRAAVTVHLARSASALTETPTRDHADPPSAVHGDTPPRCGDDDLL